MELPKGSMPVQQQRKLRGILGPDFARGPNAAIRNGTEAIRGSADHPETYLLDRSSRSPPTNWLNQDWRRTPKWNLIARNRSRIRLVKKGHWAPNPVELHLERKRHLD